MKKAAPEWGAAESAKQKSKQSNRTSARLLQLHTISDGSVIEGGQ